MSAPGFEPGDRVEFVGPRDRSQAVKGETYTVERGGDFIIRLEGITSWMYAREFKAVEPPAAAPAPVSNAVLLQRLLDAHHENIRLLHLGRVSTASERVAARDKSEALRAAVLARMEEPEPERVPQPGDRCAFVSRWDPTAPTTWVEHHEPCSDGYATGTITDVTTGKVVKR